MTSLFSPANWASWLLAMGLLFNCSCSGPMLLAGKPAVPQGWWHGEGATGKSRIVIDLSEQQIHYFKGGNLVGVSPISSGREGHSTMTGSYHIVEKDVDHRSSLYGAFCDANRQIVVPDVDNTKDECPPGTHFIGASMPFFMRITGGVGMHEGYLPGYPASHGCIRLPREMAEAFYFATPVGTPVEIKGSAPLDAVAAAPLPPDPAKTIGTKSKSAPTVASASTSSASARGSKRASASWWPLGKKTDKPAPKPFGATQYLQ